MRSLAKLLAPVAALLATAAHAEDQGYRLQNGECRNPAGTTGYNPMFIGPCGALEGALLGRLDLTNLDLSGSALSSADLRRSTISGANLGYAKLLDAVLTGVEALETDFSHADLTGANLRRLQGFGSKFNGAKIERAELAEADLGSAHFDDANLNSADLSAVQLSQASLRNAKFVGTKMRRAKLNEAVLDGADLSQANLRGADLTGASMTGTTLTGAVFDRGTLLPMTVEQAEQAGMLRVRGASRYRVVFDKGGGVCSGTAGFGDVRLRWDDTWQLNSGFTQGAQTNLATGTIGDQPVNVSATTTYSGYPLANAFDDNQQTTYFPEGGIFSQQAPYGLESGRTAPFIDFDFGDGNDVELTGVQVISAFDPNCPVTEAHVEAYNDGVWEPVEGAVLRGMQYNVRAEVIW